MDKTSIRHSGTKGGIAKISNTEMKNNKDIVLENPYYKIPIVLEAGNIELENVKIVNPGIHAIYGNGEYIEKGEIRIKGILEIEDAEKEAILLKTGYSSSKENPIELYIDGDIKQKGDTYTIKAEKEGVYTRVYYDENKIERGSDKWSNAYYNTKNREGNEPQLPEYEEQENVEVRNEAQLVSALEDSSIKTIDIKNDILLDTKNDISIKGDGKEIKGNGYAIKIS